MKWHAHDFDLPVEMLMQYIAFLDDSLEQHVLNRSEQRWFRADQINRLRTVIWQCFSPASGAKCKADRTGGEIEATESPERG
jgi:hypothetical protein